MTKGSRRKKEYRKNASKLHKAVGDMLHASPILSNYRIYQEYPVNMVSPYFDSGREKFDWVIMDFMVVIECHGQQHYQPVRFGGISQEEADVKFVQQIRRDIAKKNAARKAGWTYVVFKYDEKTIDIASLMAKITAEGDLAENRGISGQDRNMVSQQVKQKRKPKRNENYHKEQLRRAKEYRKQRYREQKERQNAAKRRKKQASTKS